MVVEEVLAAGQFAQVDACSTSVDAEWSHLFGRRRLLARGKSDFPSSCTTLTEYHFEFRLFLEVLDFGVVWYRVEKRSSSLAQKQQRKYVDGQADGATGLSGRVTDPVRVARYTKVIPTLLHDRLSCTEAVCRSPSYCSGLHVGTMHLCGGWLAAVL